MTANEILADIENYEKFDPVKGTVEGKTYVVVPTTTKTDKDSDVVINRHITLAHNTTLIFAGGKKRGIADDAITWSVVISSLMENRSGLAHSLMYLSPSKKTTLAPE